MAGKPSNIYEADGNKLSEENERLSNFDLPTKVSVDAIGPLDQGMSVLDVGAGPNTSLLDYVRSQGGEYTALDKNVDFLSKQKKAGATCVEGDARQLPLGDENFDVVHARFVISHLGSQKQKAIKEAVRVTKPSGRAIFMDYDWTTAKGSAAFEKVKDFMVNGGFLFDAGFGGSLEEEVRNSGVHGKINRKVYPPAPMSDYSQVLKLREAGTTDLKLQGNDEAAKNWNNVLDELQKEAESSDPPGFYFPGIVAVSVTKK